MRRWGYRHVITPMVEGIDVLELGIGAEQRRRLFKFADARGEVIALVGERTVPVARLVAGKLRGAPLPMRLCYAGPVLSTDDGRLHQRRETYQAGAELVGAPGTVRSPTSAMTSPRASANLKSRRRCSAPMPSSSTSVLSTVGVITYR